MNVDGERSTEAAVPSNAGPESARELAAAGADETGDAAAESLRRLESERDELRDRWLRARAEFENQRKRAQREAGEQRTLATVEAVRALLPAMDAIDSALRQTASPELRTGIELIRRQMEAGLRRLGVDAVESVGGRFDPHVHEAMEMVEDADAADDTVVEELQRGYRLQDRLIRPARVKVARKG